MVYAAIVLVPKLFTTLEKTAGSIAVSPSFFVTVHVKTPQVAPRPFTLFTTESVQLKTLAILLIL